MIKTYSLAFWFLLPGIIVSCCHNNDQESVMTGIEAELDTFDDSGNVVRSPSENVDGVDTYYVNTLKYYYLDIHSISTIQHEHFEINKDAVVFTDKYNDIVLNDGKTICTPYAEISYYDEDSFGPIYKVWFIKEGTFELNVAYGSFKTSLRICSDNDSYLHNYCWKDMFSVLPWIETLDYRDLKETIIEQGYIGVAPGSFIDVTHTTDANDMSNVWNLLNSSLIKVDTPVSQVSGGSYKEYTYITSASRETLKISNGFLRDTENDGVYYLLPKDVKINNPYQEGYKLLAYASSCEIKKVADDSSVTTIDYLNQIEFTEWGDEASSANEPLYYIDAGMSVSAKLSIYASNRFEYRGVFYKIINDKTFAFCE